MRTTRCCASMRARVRRPAARPALTPGRRHAGWRRRAWRARFTYRAAPRAARSALLGGATILCDSKMVANGITRTRLPADNAVICTLDEPAVPTLARKIGNTRTAAAMELWGERLAGAVVAIGNAPIALFRLLEMLDAGAK